MSKNIVMQELTANRYEELYPKTSASEVNFSDTTINQFLGGGEGAESALAYLSNFGKYWWKRSGNQTVYKMTTNATPDSDTYFFAGKPSEGTSDTIVMCDGLSVNKQTGAFMPVNQQSVYVRIYRDDSGVYFQWGSKTDMSWTSGMVSSETTGKYFYKDSNWYYAPQGLEPSYNSTSRFYILGKGNGYLVSSVAETKEVTDFVYSDSDSAYPKYGTSHTDGLVYWYIGSLLEAFPEMGKVETTSYIGTGSTSGTTLAFLRRPLFIAIIPSSFNYDTNNSFFFWTSYQIGLEGYQSGYNGYYFFALSSVSVSNSNFSILITDNQRLNIGNVTYYVFAITQ